jgi:L-iditol 2-dehydrogenase
VAQQRYGTNPFLKNGSFSADEVWFILCSYYILFLPKNQIYLNIGIIYVILIILNLEVFPVSNINRCLVLNPDKSLVFEDRPIPEPGIGEVLVKIAATGICGSDVRFYKDGRLGNFVVNSPVILGHESSGTIAGVGEGVTGLREGDRVAVEVGISCNVCDMCKSGRYNLCYEMVFLSAPPYDGTFCDYIVIPEHLAFPIPDSLSMKAASMTEPTAVAIHSVNRARIRPGDTGIIVGAGPIGLLTLQAFKAAGGGRAICVDVVAERLLIAQELGADEVYSPGSPALKGVGDVIFEAAGSIQATESLIDMARRNARIVQIGVPKGDGFASLNLAVLADYELDYIGVFRYANAYDCAIMWLADGRIKTDMLISHVFPFDKAVEAFNLCRDNPSETIKVVLEN